MDRLKAEKATTRLVDVMDKLRKECPWDREQTFETLRNNTIEETYELADAITDKNMEGIKEELGDLLFAAVKVGRFSGIDPEEALHRACDKFDARFRLVEEAAGKPLAEYSEEELLALWRAAKETLS